MKVVCIGDSLTYGNVGYSYIHFLNKSKDYKYINRGKNGDSLRGMFSRLKKIVDNPNTDSDLYVIGIGTNDILLPYLRDSSPFWFLLMSLRCKIKRCIEDDETFYQEYNELLNFLHEKNEEAPKIFIYLGTAYNMFGEGNYWNQGRVRQFFAENELLIGKDYWNFVCNDTNGFNVVMNQYRKSADYIKNALEEIKTLYFGKSK